MRTNRSLSGFIAGPPSLRPTRDGDLRFYARIGQRHGRKDANGEWHNEPTTYHDLVLIGRGAETAYQQFKDGDRFIAEGYVKTFQDEVRGETLEGEYFRAYKIGHDAHSNTYTVDRTSRNQRLQQGQTQAVAPAAGPPQSGQPQLAPPPFPHNSPAQARGLAPVNHGWTPGPSRPQSPIVQAHEL